MNKTFRRMSLIQMLNDISLIPALLEYSKEIASLLGFSEKASQSIQLALDEACNEVVNNAFTSSEQAEYDVSFISRPDGIEIRIHDMGLPYDPNLVSTFDPSADPNTQNLDGLGSYLIKQMVDVYQFNNLGVKGKEIVLIKYFDTPFLTEEDAKPDPAEENITPPGQEIKFDLRLMRQEEALEVCRCIYDCYGYSYANENVYYPERLAAMNQTGKLLSAVAVTESNEMAGHVAMIFYEHQPPEIGIAVTKQKFRNQGFARQLSELLEAEVYKRKLPGYQVKQVTAHPYTQKFSRKVGFKDCGMLLAHSPRSLSFKGIADQLKQRNTDVLGYKYIETPPLKTVYAPARHLDMIKKLYANLERPVQIIDADQLKPTEELTVMSVSINPIRSLSEIVISKFGKDFVQSIKQQMRKIFIDEIQVIELYLSLEDPITPYLSPQLEDLGFIFTGIMPETSIGDCLIMQYFNGTYIEYGAIVLISDVAQDLLQYIRSNDPHAFDFEEVE